MRSSGLGGRGSLVPAATGVLCLHGVAPFVVAGVGEVRTPRHRLFSGLVQGACRVHGPPLATYFEQPQVTPLDVVQMHDGDEGWAAVRVGAPVVGGGQFRHCFGGAFFDVPRRQVYAADQAVGAVVQDHAWAASVSVK